MRVNGKPYAHRAGLTLQTLLAELRVDPRRVAVMHGEVVYHAGKIPAAPVAADDVIEIVTMLQGG